MATAPTNLSAVSTDASNAGSDDFSLAGHPTDARHSGWGSRLAMIGLYLLAQIGLFALAVSGNEESPGPVASAESLAESIQP